MNSIKFAQLAHDFVRNRLCDQDHEDLMQLLYDNPELLEYIAIEHTIYQIGLRREKENGRINQR